MLPRGRCGPRMSSDDVRMMMREFGDVLEVFVWKAIVKPEPEPERVKGRYGIGHQ